MDRNYYPFMSTVHGCDTRPRFCVVPSGLLQYSFRWGAKNHNRQATTSVERCRARCQTVSDTRQFDRGLSKLTHMKYKKAVLSQRKPRDAPYIWMP